MRQRRKIEQQFM